ncbi:arginine N-methyltransferase-like protein [Dendryphion nanum]|uniref:Arginine N-methyltransferase 2 n=1 Tax=Dendryphion nanum TaxID=256645 RepID=A0A9P9D7T4_9PLEO|nr:arginine N-methyltransferase-like protein [Dendryphion nanum]
MDDLEFEIETDLQTHSILLASAHHDITALRDLLRNSSANVQDEETGFTPLHAAVAALEKDEIVKPSEVDGHTNGVTNGAENEESPERKAELEAAVKTVKLLFQNGAIWNDLDVQGETAGCIARRLGLGELYELFVDAGVRAELLLSRLDSYLPLGDDDSDDDEEEDEEEEREEGERDVEGVTEELENVNLAEGDESTQSQNYLSSTLTFDRDRLLDEASNGVMMEWERTLMRRSAELLLPKDGLRVLNVGHGMGIIDSIFQSKAPVSHHIVEAHPDVIKRMKEQGWHEKPNVTIHEGRWQDVVPKLVEEGVLFDAIYFDTFAEDYKALREFFTEYVIGLIDGEEGKFGFFNGMGADRQISYDVYQKVVEMDLFEAGFDVEWETIPVPDLESEGEWEGVRRKYWVLDTYRLPTCNFIG